MGSQQKATTNQVNDFIQSKLGGDLMPTEIQPQSINGSSQPS